MQVLGLNFNKILAERVKDLSPTTISTNVRFDDINEKEIALLKEDGAIKVSFTFTVLYELQNKKNKDKIAEISFSGDILLSAKSEEIKSILKDWKNKDISTGLKDSLINLILKKCTIKALDLEDKFNLPTHLPFPIAKTEAKAEEKK